MATVSLTRSRVVPGVAVTMARSRSTRRLNKLDLPTLGRPTMASVSPLMDDLAVSEASSQLFERFADGGDALKNCGVGQNGNIVLGKIDAGFEHRDQLD